MIASEMLAGRFVPATVAGETYQIPVSWLVEACQRFGGYQEAVTWWVQQEQMERAYVASQQEAA